MPLVTIIIPVYNTEKYLKKCLDSVITQTYKNIEIMIINDASPDNAEKIIEDYVKIYKNIKVINNSINIGVGASRNKGLEQANGDYIYFLDSDDFLKESAISTFVNLALEYNGALVEAKSKTVFNQKKIKVKDTPNVITQIDIENNKEYLCTQDGVVWNKLYKHSLLENERFPENLIFEDAAFLFPLLTKAKKSVKTNEVLYYYYKHQNSIITSMKTPNEKIFDIFPIFELISHRCYQLDTYASYETILKELTKEKYLFILMEINAWFPLGFKNHMLLLNYLRQYIEQEFDFNSLFSAKIVKEKIKQNPFYRAKIDLLNKHLKLARKLYPTISYEPLEDAKRMITKYKR